MDWLILSAVGIGGNFFNISIGINQSPREVLAAPLHQLSADAAHLGMSPSGIIGLILLVAVPLLSWSLVGVYYVLFESSRLRATPGKLLCGLIVVDLDGNQISMSRAVARHFAKLLFLLTVGIGFMLAAWTDRKQALHDLISGCLVLKKVEAAATVAVPPAQVV